MAAGKILIVAEKPSVASDIAAALGVPRVLGNFENDTLVISNCIGHLVEIFTPLAEERGASLPIIPVSFGLRVIEKTKDQFAKVQALMNRRDIATVVNACDAGREGEAIFRFTYELAGCAKPMERMWLQSMSVGGIRTAWKERKPGRAYAPLGDAARSRAEADWLTGINGSRAARSALGRVMTPTLALVVRRYLANKHFKPDDYYEIHGTFGVSAGEYVARWESAAAESTDRSRLSDHAKARAIVAKCSGVAPSSVSEDVKPTRSAPPLLFDLTTLQREANRRFKFSAKKTLDIAQALYEKHKVLSYPRTDSTALPEDYLPKVVRILGAISAIPAFRPHAQRVCDNGWVVPNKRIFNDAKITDHFAITPTGIISATMSPDEQKIYDLVCLRFIAVLHPDAEYLSTVRLTVVAAETFRASGRVLVKAGWLDVYGGAAADDDAIPSLVKISKGEPVRNLAIELKALKTKAPALYTEATLLAAMESAGKSLDGADADAAAAMKDRGLGTPATRAATIEKLLMPGKLKSGAHVDPYMERNPKSQLVPTERGVGLIEFLVKSAPKLTSPVITGEWEFQLKQMELGKVLRKDFMATTEAFIRELVDNLLAAGAGAGAAGGAAGGGTPITISGVASGTACPKCSKGVLQLRTCGPATRAPGKQFLSCSSAFAKGAAKCDHVVW